jgi:hypothetical protein
MVVSSDLGKIREVGRHFWLRPPSEAMLVIVMGIMLDSRSFLAL